MVVLNHQPIIRANIIGCPANVLKRPGITCSLASVCLPSQVMLLYLFLMSRHGYHVVPSRRCWPEDVMLLVQLVRLPVGWCGAEVMCPGSGYFLIPTGPYSILPLSSRGASVELQRSFRGALVELHRSFRGASETHTHARV